MLLSISGSHGNRALYHGSPGVQATWRHDSHPAGHEDSAGCSWRQDPSGEGDGGGVVSEEERLRGVIPGRTGGDISGTVNFVSLLLLVLSPSVLAIECSIHMYSRMKKIGPIFTLYLLCCGPDHAVLVLWSQTEGGGGGPGSESHLAGLADLAQGLPRGVAEASVSAGTAAGLAHKGCGLL